MAPEPDWNLRMVRSREAMRRLPKKNKGVNWKDIRVAQLDTGYTEHPAFGYRAGEKPWLLVREGLNLLGSGLPIDPLDYDGNPGHGSRVLSVLCGEHVWSEGDPLGSQIGVAPRLPVVPCRVVESVVLHDPSHRDAVASGIHHAIEIGCQVISISLGIPFFLRGGNPMGEASDEAYEAGVIVVAAGGQEIDSVCYPGKFNRTISVGGVDRSKKIYQRYKAGMDEIDVWAPAADVLRLDSLAAAGADTKAPTEGEDPGAEGIVGSGGSPSTHEGKPGWGEGTSYATAHVAAAAAMWLLRHGSDLDSMYGDERWQRVAAFKQLLRDTCEDYPRLKPKIDTGILNIEKLLDAELPAPEDLTKADEDKDKHQLDP